MYFLHFKYKAGKTTFIYIKNLVRFAWVKRIDIKYCIDNTK